MTDEKSVRKYRSRLLGWYRRTRRAFPWRETTDPYRVWVSEVMLQQTQAATVVPYYSRFVARYPDVLTLARAGAQDVLKAWEKMGYYARARNLHAAARHLAETAGGRVPGDYDAFRALPGVGDYIAAAVMSIAFGAPYPVVDGNVRRVAARLGAIDSPIGGPDRVFREEAARLFDARHPGDYNQAVMELGAVVCRPRTPRCDVCPVSGACEAFRTARQAEFPVRRARKPLPHYRVAVGVIERGGRVLITRRKDSGLLGGLWEFPGGKIQDGETAEAACRREIAEEVNLTVDVGEHLARVDHAYTHFKIALDVYACRYRAGEVALRGATDFRWVLVDEIDDYPFPGANHKFIPAVKEKLRGAGPEHP